VLELIRLEKTVHVNLQGTLRPKVKCLRLKPFLH
jgi:hypothetical protein